MEIRKRIVSGLATIDISGDTRSVVGEELQETISELLDQGHLEIVVNLEHVSFLDSAGLGEIVHAYSTVSRRGGKLRVEGLNQQLQDQFLKKLTK